MVALITEMLTIIDQEIRTLALALVLVRVRSKGVKKISRLFPQYLENITLSIFRTIMLFC